MEKSQKMLNECTFALYLACCVFVFLMHLIVFLFFLLLVQCCEFAALAFNGQMLPNAQHVTNESI